MKRSNGLESYFNQIEKRALLLGGNLAWGQANRRLFSFLLFVSKGKLQISLFHNNTESLYPFKQQG